MIRPLHDRVYYQPVGRLKVGSLFAPGSDPWCGLVRGLGRGVHADALRVDDWIWVQPQTDLSEMFAAEGGLLVRAAEVAGYWRAGSLGAPSGRVALRPDPDVAPLHRRDSGIILLRKSVPYPSTGTLSTGERVLWETRGGPQLRVHVGEEAWIFLAESCILGIITEE